MLPCQDGGGRYYGYAHHLHVHHLHRHTLGRSSSNDGQSRRHFYVYYALVILPLLSTWLLQLEVSHTSRHDSFTSRPHQMEDLNENNVNDPIAFRIHPKPPSFYPNSHHPRFSAYYEELCLHHLLPHFQRDIERDLKHWSGRSFRVSTLKRSLDDLSDSVPSHAQYLGLFQLRNGRVYHRYAGVDLAAGNVQYTDFISSLEGEMRAHHYYHPSPPPLPDTWMLLNVRDYPVVYAFPDETRNERGCPDELQRSLMELHGYGRSPFLANVTPATASYDRGDVADQTRDVRYDFPVMSATSIGACFHDILYPFYEIGGGGEWWGSGVVRDFVVPVAKFLGLHWYPRMEYLRGSTPWSQRKDVVVWRGAASGGRLNSEETMHTNQRVRLVEHGQADRTGVYDFGFTDARPEMWEDNPKIKDMLRQPISMPKQVGRYKYMVDLDGNTYSQRLPLLLSSDIALLRTGLFLFSLPSSFCSLSIA